MDCKNCDSGEVIVEDLEITGVNPEGELEVEFVTYRCLECDNVWTR